MNERIPIRTAVACGVLAVLWLAVGCEQDRAEPAVTTTSESPVTDNDESAAHVARAVVIGKRDACDCTRTRIDDSFAALQAALDGRDDVEVVRLQVDVDETEVEIYSGMGAMMVLPAILCLPNTSYAHE